MKKLILTMFLSFMAILPCLPWNSHRFSFGIGMFSHAYNDEVAWEGSDVDWAFPGPHDHGTYEYNTERNLQTWPLNFNLHYELTLGRHFGIGLCLGYDYQKMRQKILTIYSVGEHIDIDGETRTKWESFYDKGDLYRHILFFMQEVSAYWFKREYVAMYSKIAAGARFNVEKKVYDGSRPESTKLCERHFYCQVSPVCFEVGGKIWRGFAEFGYGGQGIAQLGVKYIIKGQDVIAEE